MMNGVTDSHGLTVLGLDGTQIHAVPDLLRIIVVSSRVLDKQLFPFTLFINK